MGVQARVGHAGEGAVGRHEKRGVSELGARWEKQCTTLPKH